MLEQYCKYFLENYSVYGIASLIIIALVTVFSLLILRIKDMQRLMFNYHILFLYIGFSIGIIPFIIGFIIANVDIPSSDRKTIRAWGFIIITAGLALVYFVVLICNFIYYLRKKIKTALQKKNNTN